VTAGCFGIVVICAVGYYYKYRSRDNTAGANPFFSSHSSSNSNSNHCVHGSGNRVGGASTEGVASSSSLSSYPASANANTIPDDLVDVEIVPMMKQADEAILPRLYLHMNKKQQQQQQQMTSSSSRVSTNTWDLLPSTTESGLVLESLTDSTL